MAITVVVLLIFPWDAIVTLNPFRLWFMLGYTIFGAYVLSHTGARSAAWSSGRHGPARSGLPSATTPARCRDAQSSASGTAPNRRERFW
jgi:hypothetical protein